MCDLSGVSHNQAEGTRNGGFVEYCDRYVCFSLMRISVPC